jgi:hypothetical protein
MAAFLIFFIKERGSITLLSALSAKKGMLILIQNRSLNIWLAA